MTRRSVHHATFAIERIYPAAPARVFAAWADKAAKSRWFGGEEGWTQDGHVMDFRVGGREKLNSTATDGVVHAFDAVYQDIVPDERIVYAYDMHLNETRISVSLATVEFKPDGDGTRMVFTEQGAFLDGYDNVASRERATHRLLDNLGREVTRG
jgi:uncharacterized protein YndB with AHSA1/START domain